MDNNIRRVDCKTSYLEDMVRYSIIINRRRSIPDRKDGLKPVQRRILWDMFDHAHALSESSKVKCASIVGSTMELYHGHGDSCLESNCQIYGLDGNIYTIGDLYNSGVQALEILAIDPNTLQIVPAVAKAFRIGQYTDKVYHIILSNGSRIRCTGNHPFMLWNGTWVRAENLASYTRLLCYGVRDESGRPTIDRKRIQDIVYNYYNGPLEPGYVKHHIDGNPFNNIRNNFVKLTRAEHAKLHDDYNTGLNNGRETMFNSEQSYKYAHKNRLLMQLYTKESHIRKFKYAIKLLNERGLDINFENYESLRGEVYNLPIVDRLIKKGYGNSFEDLVNLQLPSVGELYEEEKKKYVEAIEFVDEPLQERKYNANLWEYAVFKVIDKMIDMCIPLTYDGYKYVLNQYTKGISEQAFNETLNRYIFEKPFIVDIQIEDVNQEPMYDFTVDGFENMLIPVQGSTNPNCMPMICVHNSIYDAMMPMTQPYLEKMPLINSKSNFGTLMGDGAAASRYTEAWLSKFSVENVIGALAVSKEVVDMSPTYTNKAMEPDYLPVKVPLLLINGASGIGLGMKVDIPSHNMNEVIDATLRLMDNPNADVVLIPDHCLPCNIIDTNWKAICNKGNGKYKARAIIDISEDKLGRPIITIKSLPNRVFTNAIIKQVNELIVKNRFPQIADIDDASKKTVNIIITLKKGSDAQFVKEALYKYTDCESTYSVNFEVIDGVNPIRMSYKSYLQSFIDFAMANKFREYCQEMQKVKTRCHQLDAYIKVLKSGEIDNIIKMIKKQSKIDDSYLIEYLIKKIGLTDLQATFIINANIKQLSIGYLKKYEEESKRLSALEKEYVQKIIDDSFIKDEVRNDLLEAKSKYGSPRMCKVIKISDDSNVPKGTFKIVITENNYIRKIGENDPVNTVRGDNPNFVIKVENTENILLFDNKGKVFKLPVHRLPIMARSDIGLDVRGIIKGLTADIIAVLYEPGIKQLSRLKMKYYITIVSENNCIKKLDIEDFLNVPPSGIIYTKLNEGDSVKDIQVIADNLDAIIYSGHKALRVSSKDIPNYKRNTLGVSAMNIRGNEKIEGLSVIYPDSTDVIVVTKSGKLNKFHISGLGVDKRNKAGSSVVKLSSGDSIKSIYGVSDKDIIHIVTTSETMDIPVFSIQSTSSISSGIKIVSTKTDKIIKVEIIKPEKNK